MPNRHAERGIDTGQLKGRADKFIFVKKKLMRWLFLNAGTEGPEEKPGIIFIGPIF